MKRSGFKMKGYSYPGSSPIKQTKFPSKGGGKIDKLITKAFTALTPKKKEVEIFKKDDFYQDEKGEIKNNLIGGNWNTAKKDVSVNASKFKNAPKISNETNYAGAKNRINKFSKMNKTKPVTVEKKVTNRDIRKASKLNARNDNAGITDFWTEKQVASKDFDSSGSIPTPKQRLVKGAKNLYKKGKAFVTKSNEQGKLTDAVMAAGITALISKIGREKTKEPIVSSTEAGGFSKINIMGGRKKKKA